MTKPAVCARGENEAKIVRSFMDSMVVTGGAGFIGANFVRLALAESELRIVVVDKLTYAGSLENLSAVSNHPRFKFIQADIANATEIDELFESISLAR
jgi:dTDP-glucose 4,6-dehydratase